jgi:hypothetical protein
MTVNILFGKKAGKIAELQLDASISESHQYENEVTQFTVESGATISDHVYLHPEKVDIDGFVTNTPITVVYEDVNEILEKKSGVIEVKSTSREGVISRVETARDVLLRISGRKVQGENQDPEVIDIITSLRVYTNMILTSLTIPRDAGMGQSLHFSASFTKYKTVTSKTVPQSMFKDKTQWQIDKSKQTPTNATKKQKENTSKIKNFWNRAVREYSPKKEW